MNTIKLFSLLTVVLISSCSNDDKKQGYTNIPSVNKQKLTEPFRFHKAIEVKPGLTLDVLSWGRGSDSTGAYLILRSDSTHLKYKSTSGELNGRIVDVWNMDMDSDGNPELFIQAQGKDSHVNMYVYEFGGDGNSQQIHFPDLNDSMKKGYKGKDSIYVKDGKLMREFPIFNDAESDNKSAEGKRIIEYHLGNNSISAKEIKDTSKKDK